MAVKQFDEFEVFRARVLKAYRAAIRLKHSLAADEEIARRLPQVQADIDTALLGGAEISVDPASAFGEVL